MERAEIERLRELRERATPGPWLVHARSETTVLAGDGYSATRAESNMFDSYRRNVANAELIIAAVNALPELLRLALLGKRVEEAPVGEVEECDRDRYVWTRLPRGQRVALVGVSDD